MKSTLKALRAGSRFLLTTHFLPDGDGLGSQMALHFALTDLGKTTYVINPSETPEKFSLVDPTGIIEVYAPGRSLPEVDAVLIFDTNELQMLGPFEAAVVALGKPIVFVDHHIPEAIPDGPHFVDETFAATGEMAYALIDALGAPLPFHTALALYVAISTDTAGFRYRRTSPYSHTIAARLLESGVEPEKVYHAIFARESASKLRLLGHTLEGLQTAHEGRVAWVSIRKADRDRYGATVEDTESFLGSLGLLAGVQISALFREEDDGRVKVSLRGQGDVSVFELARSLGGGGHRFAAGARVSGPMPEVVARVLAGCAKLLA